jgi:long-subunit acyl-CoA synthetase (AMP-forming)
VSTAAAHPAASRSVDAPHLAAALRITAAAHPDTLAVRTPDDAVSLSWSEALTRVDAIAGGLAALGIARGDTVALMMGNRPEFHLADLGVVTLGATPFSIYETLPVEEIRYLLEDADARVAIVAESHLAAVRTAAEGLAGLRHIVLLDGEPPDGVLSLTDLERQGAGFDGAAAAAQTAPEDIVTLIYTSGTTGPPKGVQLTHANVMAAARMLDEILGLPAGSRLISWLPAAHIAERMANHYVPVVFAGSITTCPNPREIVALLPQVRPTWFFAVPRIWEKLKAGLEAQLASAPEEHRRPLETALADSLERVRRAGRGEPVPDDLAERVARADAELFANLRVALGFDQALAVNVGAAPTPPEVIEFFHAIGIELGELWGMSETCGAGACNRPGAVRIGTVGPASPGFEFRIAEDGEILCRGPAVMAGYRNQPERTAETIDAEGWLHTGDIGTLDEDGYLRIVDRKKEIIINAAGKNMSPANIEATVKAASPLIGQVCCIGDARPYNTALVVLDADFAPAWAARNGIAASELAELATDERVRAAVQAGVDAANAKLARVEQIKRFTIVPGDWAPGGEELTPTMKLKRRPIAAKYAAEIDALYTTN